MPTLGWVLLYVQCRLNYPPTDIQTFLTVFLEWGLPFLYSTVNESHGEVGNNLKLNWRMDENDTFIL